MEAEALGSQDTWSEDEDASGDASIVVSDHDSQMSLEGPLNSAPGEDHSEPPATELPEMDEATGIEMHAALLVP